MLSNDIHSGHRNRLRKRFLETGTDGFQQHELLELLLFYALPRVNTNEISHMLIEEYKDISNVFDSEIDELKKINGLSDSSALFIKLIRDLCRSYAFSCNPKVKFSSTEQIFQYLINYFSDACSDVCLIINVNMQLEIINTLSYPHSSLLSGAVTARDIAETTIKNKLQRIIIAFNHAGKLPVPGEDDYKTTKFFSDILNSLNVEIYDSIICSGGKCFSMRKSGAFSFNEEVSQLL